MVHTLAMSAASMIIEWLLCCSGASEEISEKAFYQWMRKNAIKNEKETKRLPLLHGVKVVHGVYCGMNYFVFTPREIDSTKTILYIHGSGYVCPHQRMHLRFAAALARNLHVKVYFPLYPKLPFATIRSCFALLNNYYAFLHKKGEVLLVGDSSGGALALSLAAEQPSIESIVAISPWVLLSIGEEGRRVESDKILSLSKLDYAARLWRDDVDEIDVRVSPFFGDYSHKNIMLFVGERERFRPDVYRFFREQSGLGSEITYIEGLGQQHCYPLMSTPEGKEARETIYRKLRGILYGDNV